MVKDGKEGGEDMKIYKYPLQLAEVQTVDMPKGAKILCAGAQNGSIVIWAMVNPTFPLGGRTIRIVGTGWETKAGIKYISSVQIDTFVWHIFEEEGDNETDNL